MARFKLPIWVEDLKFSLRGDDREDLLNDIEDYFQANHYRRFLSGLVDYIADNDFDNEDADFFFDILVGLENIMQVDNQDRAYALCDMALSITYVSQIGEIDRLSNADEDWLMENADAANNYLSRASRHGGRRSGRGGRDDRDGRRGGREERGGRRGGRGGRDDRRSGVSEHGGRRERAREQEPKRTTTRRSAAPAAPKAAEVVEKGVKFASNLEDLGAGIVYSTPDMAFNPRDLVIGWAANKGGFSKLLMERKEVEDYSEHEVKIKAAPIAHVGSNTVPVEKLTEQVRPIDVDVYGSTFGVGDPELLVTSIHELAVEKKFSRPTLIETLQFTTLSHTSTYTGKLPYDWNTWVMFLVHEASAPANRRGELGYNYLQNAIKLIGEEFNRFVYTELGIRHQEVDNIVNEFHVAFEDISRDPDLSAIYEESANTYINNYVQANINEAPDDFNRDMDVVAAPNGFNYISKLHVCYIPGNFNTYNLDATRYGKYCQIDDSISSEFTDWIASLPCVEPGVNTTIALIDYSKRVVFVNISSNSNMAIMVKDY